MVKRQTMYFDDANAMTREPADWLVSNDTPVEATSVITPLALAPLMRDSVVPLVLG